MPTNQHNKTSRNPMFENQDKIEYFLRWHLYLLKMNGNNNPVKQELILQKQKLAVRVHGATKEGLLLGLWFQVEGERPGRRRKCISCSAEGGASK